MITAEEYRHYESYKRQQSLLTKANRYIGTPFEALSFLPSRTKGSEIEKIVQEFYEYIHVEVLKAVNTGHDRVIDKLKVEIKGSLLWKSTNAFVWQQIRPESDFDACLFVAVYPECIRFFTCTYEQLEKYVFSNPNMKQHGGKNSKGNTYWIKGSPEDFPFFTEVNAAQH